MEGQGSRNITLEKKREADCGRAVVGFAVLAI